MDGQQSLILALADARGRLNLDGTVTPGTHYIVNPMIGADGEPNGTVMLTPVKVATTAVKRAASDEDQPQG